MIDHYTTGLTIIFDNKYGPARIYNAHMEGFLATECRFLACWFFTMGNIVPITLNLFLLFFCLAHISKIFVLSFQLDNLLIEKIRQIGKTALDIKKDLEDALCFL